MKMSVDRASFWSAPDFEAYHTLLQTKRDHKTFEEALQVLRRFQSIRHPSSFEALFRIGQTPAKGTPSKFSFIW